MRPTLSPSTSRTWVPRRSSIFTSTLFLLLRPAAGNVLDDMFRDPKLPIQSSRLLGFYVQLDFLADGLDARPWNFHCLVTFWSPHFAKPVRQSAQCWMEAHPERGSANENVGHPRLGILTKMHHEPADPSHAAVLSVNQLLVQDVAYQIHLSLR